MNVSEQTPATVEQGLVSARTQLVAIHALVLMDTPSTTTTSA